MALYLLILPLQFNIVYLKAPGFKLKLKVMDYDFINSHDLVDLFRRRIAINPSVNEDTAVSMQLNLVSRTNLNLEVKVFCDSKFIYLKLIALA